MTTEDSDARRENTKMERLNFSWLIPGKIAGHGGPMSRSDLEFLHGKGVRALVRMAENPAVTHSDVGQSGLLDYHEPVPDFAAPTEKQLEKIIGFINECVSEGKPVAVSCRAGVGRTGTVLACYLVSAGFSPEAALEEVRRKRGAGLETPEQKEAVRNWAKRRGA